MTEYLPPVITVDGPSGTGKGTLGVRLANRLGWHFLDSGALYRALALVAMQQGITLDDEQQLQKQAAQLEVTFVRDRASDLITVLLDGKDISEEIRTELCANAASRVAALAKVRQALLTCQRAFRKPPGLVADGRDMGTVVFPDAELKVFLTASQEERAKRRYKQLREKGISANLEELLKDIAERDARDSLRSVSPLRPAPNALIVDTTNVDIKAVFERVMQLVYERILRNR